MKLKDQVALVTGGSSGIGEAIARTFAREGAVVAVAGRNDLSKAEAVAAAIRDAGGRAHAFVADVRSAAAASGLVNEVAERFSTIDILVNSAGVYFPTEIGNTTEDDFDRMVDTNLKGLFFGINSVTPIMRQRGSGVIINLATAAAFVGSKDYPLYCAVKAAVVMLTRALALQLAPAGIRINAIAPGFTATPMNQDIRTAPEFAGRRAALATAIPSSRKFTPPEEIAGGALFLASEDGRSMHGATLLMDEGRSAGW